jgi:hypothetical protein
MKINGKVLDSLRIVSVYLPVANNDAVEFKFRPLRSDESFEKVSPRPKPPKQVRPGGVETFDTSNPAYRSKIDHWAASKVNWEFLTSISATDGLEWSTVDMDKPETWANWKAELDKLFPDSHIAKIYQGFIDAQYITEEMMEKARQLFLQRTLAQSVEVLPSDLSQEDEKTSTESGEHVSG